MTVVGKISKISKNMVVLYWHQEATHLGEEGYQKTLCRQGRGGEKEKKRDDLRREGVISKERVRDKTIMCKQKKSKGRPEHQLGCCPWRVWNHIEKYIHEP